MYQRILVALDDSACAQRALAEAIRLAGLSDATLLAITAVDNGPLLSEPYAPDVPEAADVQPEAARALLGRAKQACDAARVKGSGALLECGGEKVSWVVLRAASDFGADLIVLGTHGRSGLRRLALGSVAEAVLRSSQCPVLVIRDESTETRPAGSAA